METVSIQLPATLYTSIYQRYQEGTSKVISACLVQLIHDENQEETTRVELPGFQYPRPRTGTITGRVWEIADRIQKDNGGVNRESVITACMLEGININTASTQFSYWKKANT